MTPEQKIKHAIILKAQEWDQANPNEPITADNIDEMFDELNEDWALQDATNEVRCTGTPTGLPAPGSRNYESTAVAAKMPDGSWVGWTYWYGGGKHGEPEAIDWMDEAYDVTVVEEEKLTIVRTFARVEAA